MRGLSVYSLQAAKDYPTIPAKSKCRTGLFRMRRRPAAGRLELAVFPLYRCGSEPRGRALRLDLLLERLVAAFEPPDGSFVERHDVRRDAIEEPPVVSDDD